MPFLIGKVPGAATDSERVTFLNNLKDMVQDAVAVINDDESIEIPHVLSGTTSVDIYDKMVSFCNREISKAILGQNLSTEVEKGGSYAATKAAIGVKSEHVDRIKRIVCNVFNKALQWQSQLNSLSNCCYPTFHFFEESDYQLGLASRDKILTEQGLKFSKDYYKRNYYFEDSDFEINNIKKVESKKTGSDFAEDTLINEWTDVDKVSDNAVKKTVPVIQNLIQSVLSRIQKAKSYEEIQEILYVIYPDLDIAEFRELTEKAMAFTGMLGYVTSEQEK
jgi:phage gp29-like protein